MVDLDPFSNLALPGGFLLTGIAEEESAMIDAIGRPALAKATIIGRRISIQLSAGMDDEQKSISIYHEVLEGLTVAFDEPPPILIEFNEADFEAAAVTAHLRLGFAEPGKVINMLETFGY